MNSEAKIQELEAKVTELSALVERLTASATTTIAPVAPVAAVSETPTATASRRNMLKLAGAAAVGAAAAAATSALPAAATNGINIGDPALPVRNDYTGNASTAAFLFQAGTQFANGAAAFPCALAGWSSSGGSNLPNGIYGFTNNGGYGLVGIGGGGTSVGLLASGTRANVALSASGSAAPSRTAAYSVGDVVNDSDGNLWLNVVAGSPGQWRKLAGPTTSGTLHLISPKRVYDSRVGELPATAPKTPLSGATRTIDCTLNGSGVPAGALGLLLNVSAVSSTANGYLAVTPGGAGFTGTSTLNWTAVGAIVANSVTVASGPGATIDVTVGGGGTANFFVDVFGFYA